MVPLNLIPDVVRNLAHEHKQVVSISLFVAILCLCLVIAHLLEENRWVNESIFAIVVVSLKPTLFEFILFFVGSLHKFITLDNKRVSLAMMIRLLPCNLEVTNLNPGNSISFVG